MSLAEKGGGSATEAPLVWLSADDYNPKDHSLKKRFKGYVKPVRYVHKFKVGLLILVTKCIFCNLNFEMTYPTLLVLTPI